MRILHLSKFYRPDPGGLEHVVQQLAEGAAARGHQVRVIAATGSGWIRDPKRRITEPPRGNVVVVRIPTYGVRWSQPIAPGYLAAAHWPADVAHVHHPHPLADLSTVLSVRAPYVVTQHSDIRRQLLAKPFYWPLVRHVLHYAAAIVVPTEAHLRACSEIRGYEKKIRVIPFGVDLDRFTPRAHPERPPTFPDPGAPVALFVGRLVGYKGLGVLLDAVRGTALRVVIVGDGPERRSLEERITRDGLEGQVRLAGRVSDDELSAYYQAADYFVLPSVTAAEMFGIVLLEAMALGKPVITTALETGVREVNRTGETGLEVPVGDAAALRAAMERLAGDAELRQRLGGAGRTRVEERFTLEKMIAGHLALYEEVVEQRRRKREGVRSAG